jgi:type IX secretion system PorP/SprF family membrane protein
MKTLVRSTVIVVVLVLCYEQGRAQQDAMYSQYMFNYLAVNPGYAGSRDVLSATGLYRKQWVNVEGAPSTTTFAIDMPIRHEQMGIGLMVFNDQIGVEKNTGLYASYAYRLRLTKKGTLAFGANIGFAQYRASLGNVDPKNPTTPDQAFSRNVNNLNPNFGFGVFYSTDRFYLSASLPHVLASDLIESTELQSRLKKHYFLGAGYVFRVNPNLTLKPSVLVKVVEGAPMQGDANLNAWLMDKVGLGVSYRTGDAVVLLAEFQLLPALRFGYAYDITTTRLARYASGTHELMLRYEFATRKKKIVTPRYF